MKAPQKVPSGDQRTSVAPAIFALHSNWMGACGWAIAPKLWINFGAWNQGAEFETTNLVTTIFAANLISSHTHFGFFKALRIWGGLKCYCVKDVCRISQRMVDIPWLLRSVKIPWSPNKCVSLRSGRGVCYPQGWTTKPLEVDNKCFS